MDRPVEATLSQVVERYLTFKTDHGKRSLHEDKRILEKQLLPAFGPGCQFGNSQRRRSPSTKNTGSRP